MIGDVSNTKLRGYNAKRFMFLLVYLVIFTPAFVREVTACCVTNADIWAGKTQSEANSKVNDPDIPIYICTGSPAYFYAECSVEADPEGRPIKWTFDYDDETSETKWTYNSSSGPTSAGTYSKTASHTYNLTGAYTITVTVERVGAGACGSKSATCKVTVVSSETLVLMDKETKDSKEDHENGGPPPPGRLYVDVVADGKGDVEFWMVGPEDGAGATYPWEIIGAGRSGYLNNSNNYKRTETNLDPGDYTLRVTKEGDSIFERKIWFTVVEIDISACSTQEGCFAGYGQRCTPDNWFSFTTGKDFLDGLVDKTTENGKIGDLYIFSHAWLYNSAAGRAHNGGFYGNPANNSGFYGSPRAGDHADARYLSDLQTAINNGTIKFASKKHIFLEGCHIGEIGTFVAELAGMTGRTITSCCGESSEDGIGSNWVRFHSGPANWEERTNPDYDGWLSGAAEIGEHVTVPY